MKMHSIRRLIFLPLSVVFALAVSGAASAAVLEEIFVTAQKQEENIQDVPVSVSAYSGEQLSQLGYSDTTEITQQVPGLQLNTWSPNLTIFNLRGVSQNNFTDNLEAPVAVYFDESYVASINGISGQLYDIERVEVVRGPQGTLFGRNATGGLIHYISKGADEAEFNSYVALELGDYRDKSMEFALGGGTDAVRARFSARAVESDGYIESRDSEFMGMTFPGSGRDIGGEDSVAARLNVQIDFSNRLSGDFWVKWSEDDQVATGGYVFESCMFDGDGLCPTDQHGRTVTMDGVVNPLTGETAGVHEHFGEERGHLDRETSSIQGRFDYEIGDHGTFSSITSRFRLKKDYLEDGDALPLLVVNFRTQVDYEQLSQEFRFSAEEDWVRWQVGLYFLDIESDGRSFTYGAPSYNNVAQPAEPFQGTRLQRAGGMDSLAMDGTRVQGSPADSFNDALSIQDIVLDSRNWSIFGQADFQVTEDVEITAGLRWSRDNKKMDWRLNYQDASNPNPILIDSSEGFSAQNSNVDEIEYGDWAARLALKWRIDRYNHLFVSVNRGIKGGNWAVGTGSNLTAETFRHDEEVLHSFEVGVKSDLLEVLRINATAFYYDYQDYQAFSLSGGAPFVANTDAEASGAEIEVVWTPTDSWDLLVGATFMESSVDEVLGNPDPRNRDMDGNLIIPDPITDAELPNAPELSFNFLARYAWLYEGGEFAIQLDGVYYEDQFLEVTNGPGTLQEAYGVANARISYQTRGLRRDDKMTFSAWVKNLTDEEYKIYSLDLGFLGTTTYYAPPITSGVTFRYDYR